MGLSFTHIFSSHLQRAAKTAALIRQAQAAVSTDDDSAQTVPDVAQLPVLMEQDFGFFEGKKWHARPADSGLSGKEQHRQAHKDTEGFVDIESKESMAQRVDSFLDAHLLPLLHNSTEPANHTVAVVSHGIILSVLWKRLLLRLPPRSVALSPELAATTRVSLEHLGGWSNTGYLELNMSMPLVQEPILATDALPPLALKLLPSKPVATTETQARPAQTTQSDMSDTALVAQKPLVTSTGPAAVATPLLPTKLAHGWMIVIQTINGRDHLRGLKRTGGGVGSSRHDASQKNIDSFFKRRKVE